MVLLILYFIFLIICVLVGVAFLTLFERNILGYIQVRKGPNKVGWLGLMQPFSDAIKLFTKENIYLIQGNFMAYYLCPVLGLFLSLLLWVSYPWGGGVYDMTFGILLVTCIMSMSVYPLVGCGWFSNSKYALLGCMRSIAQTISYEVSLMISLVCLMLLVKSYDVMSYSNYQVKMWFLIMLLPLAMLWLITMLAETNRTPFDFAEGESELVSGFNVEYSGGGFALIFMSEYCSIIFMSMFYSLLFLGGYGVFMFLSITALVFLFVFIRGQLPRFRYDKLMFLAWQSLLPLSLNYLVLLVSYMWVVEIFSG